LNLLSKVLQNLFSLCLTHLTQLDHWKFVKMHWCDERKGKTSLKIEQDHDSIKISVTDSGNEFRKTIQTVFEPGFNNQKRGWGLGSLTKRIVEEYHRGSIKVSHSEIGKGTTMQISLKKHPNFNHFNLCLFWKHRFPYFLISTNIALQRFMLFVIRKRLLMIFKEFIFEDFFFNSHYPTFKHFFTNQQLYGLRITFVVHHLNYSSEFLFL
jgi:hypothetical protein